MAYHEMELGRSKDMTIKVSEILQKCKETWGDTIPETLTVSGIENTDRCGDYVDTLWIFEWYD